MYRLNNLSRNVLITPDEVIAQAVTDHAFDRIKIRNSIIIAEERFIRPALTSGLYEHLIEAKNKEVTSLNIDDLQVLVNGELGGEDGCNTIEIGDVLNSSSFLSADDLKLWKWYLWKLTAEAVLVASFSENFVQFSSTGIIHANPTSGPMITSGAVTPSLAAAKWALDKLIMDRIDPLVFAMGKYLCSGKGSYPAYELACTDCNGTADVPTQKKTDWVLGIYDDEPLNCCDGSFK